MSRIFPVARRRCVPLFVFFVAAAVSEVGQAGGTRTFEQTTQEDFEQGEATGTIVQPPGEVLPGLQTTRVDLAAAFVWCAVPAFDGKTAYFGTGDEGAIYALPAAAPADKPATGKNESARLLLKLPEPWVTALAARSDGTLLAATTPGGKIYEIDPGKKTHKVFATLKADHVWALVFDRASGNTFAATGGPGQIMAIDKKGGARVLWDAHDQHVVSLLEAGGGNLLAGTSEGAILFQVNLSSGRARALHDFDADEVRAIARKGEVTFVAVNDFEGLGDVASPAVSLAKGTKIDLVTSGKSPAAAGKLPRPGAPKGKGAVYRLDAEGSIEQLHALADGYFTALVQAADGNLHAASGVEGKVYRITPANEVGLAVDVSERQALALLATPAGLLVATGDTGAVFRAAPASGSAAVYLSKVFDAVYPAQFGQIRYGASGAVNLETRSGNTAKPDDGWDGWKSLAQAGFNAIDHQGQGRVQSAAGRYLQYRVTLPRDTAFRDISIFHAPQNQRARVIDVTLEGAKATGKPAGDPTRQHSSLLKLRFKVTNPDEDTLIYQLSYRQEGEPVWRSLGPTEPLTKAEYDWNTDTVPDGRYVVRVWASDGQAVAQDRALSHTFVSPPLLVDNTRPDVTDLIARMAPGAVTIDGRANDAASALSQIEFSINGGEWRPASPKDGLLDQRSEAFSLQLPKLPAGVYVVTVRAFDGADNLGVARLVVTIK